MASNIEEIEMKEKYKSNKVETLAEIKVTIQRAGGVILAELEDNIFDDNLPTEVYHVMAVQAIDAEYEQEQNEAIQ